jgi:hypothetical protein
MADEPKGARQDVESEPNNSGGILQLAAVKTQEVPLARTREERRLGDISRPFQSLPPPLPPWQLSRPANPSTFPWRVGLVWRNLTLPAKQHIVDRSYQAFPGIGTA